MTASPFKVGTVFRHGSFLEVGPNGEMTREKAICRVTALRHGTVHYGFGADARKGRCTASPEYLLSRGAEVLS